MEELQKQNDSLRQEIKSAKSEINHLCDLRTRIITVLEIGQDDKDIFDGINKTT